jgi:hypothetical protein
VRRAYLAVGGVSLVFLALVVLQIGGHILPVQVFCGGWLVYATWLCAPAHLLAWSYPESGDGAD